MCNIFAYYDEKMGAMSASVPVPRLHVHVRRLVEAGHKVTCSLSVFHAFICVMCFMHACGKLIQVSGLAISVIWYDSSLFHRQLQAPVWVSQRANLQVAKSVCRI